MDPKNQRMYVGRSGQMAVVAELLARGINVAIPEVDVGEDIFAFQDGTQFLDRIQVKTAIDVPVLWYIFAIRWNENWIDYVIMNRLALFNLYETKDIGYENAKAGELQLHLVRRAEVLLCSGQPLDSHRNAWGLLPCNRSH